MVDFFDDFITGLGWKKNKMRKKFVNKYKIKLWTFQGFSLYRMKVM